MRVLRAVFAGFIAASALILAGGWVFSRLAAEPNTADSVPTAITGVIALLYTSAALIAGAYIAARIHDSNETTSGFAVLQAFFGFGLVREFWSTGPSLYTAAAILLVIPCAMIGRVLATRSGKPGVPQPVGR